LKTVNFTVIPLVFLLTPATGIGFIGRKELVSELVTELYSRRFEHVDAFIYLHGYKKQV
jgi:hypothetical protein